jgi:hypothetical protein
MFMKILVMIAMALLVVLPLARWSERAKQRDYRARAKRGSFWI